MALGEYEEAKDCLQRTHRIRSRVYGKYFTFGALSINVRVRIVNLSGHDRL